MISKSGPKIGVESAYSFGECLLNLPLIRALSRKYKSKIGVASLPNCKAAFENIPYVSEIVEIPTLGDGENALLKLGYDKCFQITPDVKFFEFRAQNNQHSLVDTPLLTGTQLGCTPFDQRPVFAPTPEEIEKTSMYLCDRPMIAFDSAAEIDSQTEANVLRSIIESHVNSHIVLWPGETPPFKSDSIFLINDLTPREQILVTRMCTCVYTTGRDFTFACLSLPSKYQPKKVICLWHDEIYNCRNRILQSCWHQDISWLNQC